MSETDRSFSQLPEEGINAFQDIRGKLELPSYVLVPNSPYLKCLFPTFPGADTYYIHNWRNKDLPIANFSSTRHLSDGFN